MHAEFWSALRIMVFWFYKRKIVLKVFLRLDFFSAQSAFCFFIDSAILSKVLDFPDVALSKEKDRGEIHFINNILDHRPVLCKLPSLSWVWEFLYWLGIKLVFYQFICWCQPLTNKKSQKKYFLPKKSWHLEAYLK